MKGIVLASHGKLAEGMLDTLQMFVGDPKQIVSLCLQPGQEIDEYMQKMIEATKNVDDGDGVIIFCDLLFGTPCNSSAYFLKDNKGEKIKIITGMNLPMILEYTSAREQEVKIEQIIEIGKKGIVDFNELYTRRKNI